MSTGTPGQPTPPAPPPGMEALLELAMDLRWTWNHVSDELWRRLYPELWALTQHPNVVLQTVARQKLASALADPGFWRRGGKANDGDAATRGRSWRLRLPRHRLFRASSDRLHGPHQGESRPPRAAAGGGMDALAEMSRSKRHEGEHHANSGNECREDGNAA